MLVPLVVGVDETHEDPAIDTSKAAGSISAWAITSASTAGAISSSG